MQPSQLLLIANPVRPADRASTLVLQIGKIHTSRTAWRPRNTLQRWPNWLESKRGAGPATTQDKLCWDRSLIPAAETANLAKARGRCAANDTPMKAKVTTDIIPFNLPYATGKELIHVAEAQRNHHLSGDGPFTKLCHQWIERQTGCVRALLTHSCTSALDLAALLLDLKPGDEVIMPSYTFVSTANAFVLRGAVPVFVDIREDTLNLDEKLIESAITPRTRAIVPVHYAGVACEMDSIIAIAKRHNLRIVEDAAQGIMANYKGRALGAIGDLGSFSFHETKNIHSGEGGSLLVSDRNLVLRAEIMREKGTDRGRFFRGEVDKYTWQDVGSSFLPNEITAAFLWAQLEEAEQITRERITIWQRYHEFLDPLEQQGLLRRPIVPAECQHNGHLYYLLLSPEIDRPTVLGYLKKNGINAVFHYVPLHSSPAGLRFGRAHGDLARTTSLSHRLVRLPIWIGLSEHQQQRVCEVLAAILRK
jgi:dTDP-4-amino-4,6-dideoxygalactose transaminase